MNFVNSAQLEKNSFEDHQNITKRPMEVHSFKVQKLLFTYSKQTEKRARVTKRSERENVERYINCAYIQE
jgi:hypothetical protein